jgi:uncharacterized protein with HEPN domain
VRSDELRLADILAAIGNIERRAAQGREAFASDELLQVWMLHHREIIGEALRSMSAAFQTQYRDRIDWSGWVGLRGVLAHQYFRVDPTIVWETVERDIPKLKASLLDIRQESARGRP